MTTPPNRLNMEQNANAMFLIGVGNNSLLVSGTAIQSGEHMKMANRSKTRTIEAKYSSSGQARCKMTVVAVAAVITRAGKIAPTLRPYFLKRVSAPMVNTEPTHRRQPTKKKFKKMLPDSLSTLNVNPNEILLRQNKLIESTKVCNAIVFVENKCQYVYFFDLELVDARFSTFDSAKTSQCDSSIKLRFIVEIRRS